MTVRQYEAYKPSGVEWLGDVPSHWVVAPIKYHFRVAGGATPKSDLPEYWEGDIPWFTPVDLSDSGIAVLETSARSISEAGLVSCSANLVPAGSVLMSTRAPIGSLGIAKTPATTNQGCKSLVPKGSLSSTFLASTLLVGVDELRIRGKGSTFLELSGDELGSFPVPVPTPPEQCAIAAFLDRETAKIDALVEEQQRLIELLKEKRQAVISHAVTKGLDPTAPMKPSGIEWLGDVPAHWRLGKVGQFGRLQGGFAFPSEAFQADGVPVIRMNNLSRGNLTLEGASCIDPQICRIAVALCVGDLLWGMSGSIGETGSLGNFGRVREADLPLQLNQRVGRFVPVDHNLDLNFMEFVVQSSAFSEQVVLSVTGTAQFNISSEQVQSICLVWPSLMEQAEIAKFLKRNIAELNTLTTTAETAITLLQERRAALISAAVTGKIDVRGLAEQVEAA